jgi:hypothetical protein
VTHLSLGNYIAMVSGQGSNIQTQADCQFFTDFLPGTWGSDGQVLGQGCVYPQFVQTVANQLENAGLTWHGYMEDMEKKDPKNCRHPAINSQDDTQSAEPGDQYAARHNPFVYFRSIIDFPTCAANDVPLERLSADLASVRTTPNYSFITPNLCHDGHDAPCAGGHEPGGLESADAFLRQWVPRILASPAFADGLLMVTFDESESGAESCCNEPQFPNTPSNGGPDLGSGGGRTGTVLLSPFVLPGSKNETPYNHFSQLRSVEDIFGLEHLGYAARPGLSAFGDDVFRNVPGLALKARGNLRRKRRGTVRVGTAVASTVTTSGACPRRRRSTSESGTLRLRVRPSRRGRCMISATRAGYAPGRTSVRVR